MKEKVKKINNYIKKHLNTIISIFIILSPILDLLVSISINVLHHNLNIGIIARMIFLLFIYYVALIIYKKKKILIYVFLSILYLIIYLTLQYDNTVVYNLHGFMRTFYFPLLLLGFYSIHDKIKIKDKTLILTCLLYILLIFIPVITKTGFNSYSISKVGSTGWFNSTNEISGIISILIPILFIELSKKDNFVLKAIISIIFLYVISEIGTKTPVLSLLIVLSSTLLYILIKSIKDKKYKLLVGIISATLLFSLGAVVLIPKTNFYKNIKIHAEYLELDSPKDIVTNEYVFDHFIFSQRISFLEKTDNRYVKVKTLKKLFGMGYVNKKEKNYKEIEMDYYDVWYNHGVFGFILFFSVYFIVLVKVFKSLPKTISYDKYMKYVSLFLILILSLFSGHIITTPSVSLFAILILISLISENKRVNKIKKNVK